MGVEAVKLEPESVEKLQTALEALVRQRQHLRLAGAAPSELEHNRAAIIRGQYDLSVALIARYSPHQSAA
jgi:hypothetical protein